MLLTNLQKLEDSGKVQSPSRDVSAKDIVTGIISAANRKMQRATTKAGNAPLSPSQLAAGKRDFTDGECSQHQPAADVADHFRRHRHAAGTTPGLLGFCVIDLELDDGLCLVGADQIGLNPLVEFVLQLEAPRLGAIHVTNSRDWDR